MSSTTELSDSEQVLCSWCGYGVCSAVQFELARSKEFGACACVGVFAGKCCLMEWWWWAVGLSSQEMYAAYLHPDRERRASLQRAEAGISMLEPMGCCDASGNVDDMIRISMTCVFRGRESRIRGRDTRKDDVRRAASMLHAGC